MTVIAKYRKKTLNIEAIKWTGENSADVAHFLGGSCSVDTFDGCVEIQQASGLLKIPKGDWILRGPLDGELYCCSAGVFEQTYERIDEEVACHPI